MKLLHQYNLENLETTLRQLHIQELLSSILEFTDVLHAFGPQTRPFSQKSLENLKNIDEQRANNIACSLREIASLAKPCAHKSEKELLFLERTFQHNRIKPNYTLLDKLDSHHLVEAYDHSMRQVYRSMNFYDYTNYSMLDLLTYEWYILWEKPTHVTTRLFEMVKYINREKISCLKVPIEPFINLEVMDTGATEPFIPHAVELNPMYAGHIEKNYLTKNEYFMYSCSARSLAKGQDVHNIHLL